MTHRGLVLNDCPIAGYTKPSFRSFNGCIMADDSTVLPFSNAMPGELTEFAKEQVEGAQGRVRRAVFRPHGGGDAAPVAVKTLLAHADAQALDRLRNEGRCLKSIASPQIPRYVWDGLYNTSWVLLTEWKDGETLDVWLCANPARPAPRSRDIALGLCRAVAVAHACSPPVTHRDLGPKNILVDNQPGGACEVYVLDFGLARQGAGIGTVIHTIFGNDRYMSPEQDAGNSAQATPASDVFSIAAIVADLLREDPRPVRRARLIEKGGAANALGVAPSGFDAVWAVLGRAMDEEPAKRFSDAAQLLRALEKAWPSPGDDDRGSRLATLEFERACNAARWHRVRRHLGDAQTTFDELDAVLQGEAARSSVDDAVVRSLLRVEHAIDETVTRIGASLAHHREHERAREGRYLRAASAVTLASSEYRRLLQRLDEALVQESGEALDQFEAHVGWLFPQPVAPAPEDFDRRAAEIAECRAADTQAEQSVVEVIVRHIDLVNGHYAEREASFRSISERLEAYQDRWDRTVRPLAEQVVAVSNAYRTSFGRGAEWRRVTEEAQRVSAQAQQEAASAPKTGVQPEVERLFKNLLPKLHPDLDPDPEEKSWREPRMARLNRARTANDLAELQRLRRELMSHQQERTGTNVSETPFAEVLVAACLHRLGQSVTKLREVEEQWLRLARDQAEALGDLARAEALEKEGRDAIREEVDHLRTVLDAFRAR